MYVSIKLRNFTNQNFKTHQKTGKVLFPPFISPRWRSYHTYIYIYYLYLPKTPETDFFFPPIFSSSRIYTLPRPPQKKKKKTLKSIKWRTKTRHTHTHTHRIKDVGINICHVVVLDNSIKPGPLLLLLVSSALQLLLFFDCLPAIQQRHMHCKIPMRLSLYAWP